MRFYSLLVVATFLGCWSVMAQEVFYADAHGNRGWFNAKSPGRFASPAVPSKALKAGNITWNLTYRDVVLDTNVGFDDPAVGATRRACAEAVFTYVAEALNENSGATIDVLFNPSQTDGTGSLAAATTFWFVGAGYNNGFGYEHITSGIDPLVGTVDIEIVVDFGWSWNANPAVAPTGLQFDLFSVLLHEATHGIGILSLSDQNGNGLSDTNPDVYTEWDRLMQFGASTFCWNSLTTILQVASSAFVSNDLYFSGAAASAAFGSRPPVYAPTSFANGSSLSHFKTGAVTAVMDHAIPPGVAERTYSAVDIGALQDIGYVNAAPVPVVPPVTNFSANVTSGAAPLTVSFTDSSTNVPTSWAWDFNNDGTTDSVAKNPSHIYTTPGVYSVKLTAANEAGSDDELKTNYISVAAPPPVANFTADVTSGAAPLTVTFTDTSTGSPTSWAWDFQNDGTTDSTQQNPAHTYTTPGSYTVKLTATNATGSDVETKTNYINVTLLTTTVSVAPGTWVEEGAEVTFTAGPAGATEYQWFKGGDLIGDATQQTYTIESAVVADTGSYYCRVTTASKGVANTPTVELVVFAAGALPAGSGLVIALLLVTLAVLAFPILRRHRRAVTRRDQ